MNAPGRNSAAPIDPVKLDRLAEVAIKVGLRLERGQNLLVTAPTVALPLVRKVAEYAYKAGAGLVTPILSDEAITLMRYRFGPDESFDRAANWLYEGMSKAFAANTARLAIVADNPMLLSGEDPAKVARAIAAHRAAFEKTGADEPFALSLPWRGPPSYERARALAEGVAGGLADLIAAATPLYLIVDGDLAQTLGAILKLDMALDTEILAIDGIATRDFDYLDIGRLRLPSRTTPVTIKSLLFGAAAGRGA